MILSWAGSQLCYMPFERASERVASSCAILIVSDSSPGCSMQLASRLLLAHTAQWVDRWMVSMDEPTDGWTDGRTIAG